MRSRRLLHVRRRPLLLIATLLGLAALPLPQTPASASCAAPYLKVSERLVLERGETMTIEGRSFADGCQDSMSCSGALGCDSCKYDDPPPVPLDDVGLRLVQRGRTWTVAVADAGTAESNRLGWVEWTFEVPVDARRGPAKLFPEHAEAVPIEIG